MKPLPGSLRIHVLNTTRIYLILSNCPSRCYLVTVRGVATVHIGYLFLINPYAAALKLGCNFKNFQFIISFVKSTTFFIEVKVGRF